MFSISVVSENGFDKIVLTDHGSSAYAAILPACGAMLHEFSLLHKGVLKNVIDHYDSPQQFKSEVESLGFKGSKLSPFVCRLKEGTYHFGEQDHTIQKFYLGKNAIHGLLYDAVFTIEQQRANDEMAAVSMKYAYRKTDAGYPFDYDCTITYTLEKNNRLTIQTTIVNQDKGLIPVADGWHPYFTFGGSINDLQLEFQSREMLEFDQELIPTGTLLPYQDFGSLKTIGDTFFDNCFTLNFAECQPMLVLRDPVQQLQLEMYPGTAYPYLQVYTPPHRMSIALENLSAAPDSFNNGIGAITLEPGSSADFNTTFQLTSLL